MFRDFALRSPLTWIVLGAGGVGGGEGPRSLEKEDPTKVQDPESVASRLDRLKEELNDVKRAVPWWAMDELSSLIPNLEMNERLTIALSIEQKLLDKSHRVEFSAFNALGRIIPNLEAKDRLALLCRIEELEIPYREMVGDLFAEMVPHLEKADRLTLAFIMEKRLTDKREKIRRSFFFILREIFPSLEIKDQLALILKIVERLEAGEIPVFKNPAYGYKVSVEDQLARLFSCLDAEPREVYKSFRSKVLDIYFFSRKFPSPFEAAVEISKDLTHEFLPRRLEALDILVYKLLPLIPASKQRYLFAKLIARFLTHPKYSLAHYTDVSLHGVVPLLAGGDRLRLFDDVLNLWERSPHEKLPVDSDPVFKFSRALIGYISNPAALTSIRRKLQKKSKHSNPKIRQAAEWMLASIDKR